MTSEKFEPDAANEFVQKYYEGDQAPVYKRYVHVLPVERPPLFRLVDLV